MYLSDGVPRWKSVAREVGGLDAESMVRSCLTWDAQAIAFGEHMREYLKGEWLDRVAERAMDARDLVIKMAEMAWKFEDRMSQTALDLWPRRRGNYQVMYTEANQKWLKWEGTLRRCAWGTLLQVRDRLFETNRSKGARNRVLARWKDQTGMRLGRWSGDLWREGDALHAIVTVWSRYAVWRRHEGRIQGRHNVCRRVWDRRMGEAINQARRAKDERRVWKLMRVLGGTGRRERKRNMRVVCAEDPSPGEWQEALANPGGEGGCEAQLVASRREGGGRGSY